jgi:hypothetical protein
VSFVSTAIGTAVGAGSSILRTTTGGVVTSAPEYESEVPSHASLEQNYSKPFNPSTTIEFTVPVSGRVSLRIFDMTGREVRTLMDEHATPGTYRRIVHASDLASGVYVSRLTQEGRVMTRKMLLVK